MESQPYVLIDAVEATVYVIVAKRSLTTDPEGALSWGSKKTF